MNSIDRFAERKAQEVPAGPPGRMQSFPISFMFAVYPEDEPKAQMALEHTISKLGRQIGESLRQELADRPTIEFEGWRPGYE